MGGFTWPGKSVPSDMGDFLEYIALQMISTDNADKACHANFLLYWVHSMVKWYVVQCFQSAASAIWTNRMKVKRAWRGNGSPGCKESTWTLDATRGTLSTWWFCFVTSLWDGGVVWPSGFIFWLPWDPDQKDWCACYSFLTQIHIFDTVFLPFVLSTNIEIDLIIQAVLLCLSRIFYQCVMLLNKFPEKYLSTFQKAARTLDMKIALKSCMLGSTGNQGTGTSLYE